MLRVERFFYKVLSYLCGLLILAMALLIFWQVICRYLMNNSLTWSEELGRYIFVWITFIGLPVALKRGAHVAIDLLLKKSKGHFHMAILIINYTIIGAIGLLIAYSGIRLFQVGVGQISSAMLVPMQYVYIIIPFSGLMLAFFALTTFLEERRKFLKGEE